jgi:bifunctional non-homologous end joining protein LigD
MALTEYRRKRNFRVTSEPHGGRVAKRARRGLAFVVQKHAASHLHYDFRLELDGVLLSWAVPKGPSLDPSTKRLAMHVEDHPLEYGDFEGIIPEGEYGGGTVLLWDKGTWEPVDEAVRGYRDGALKFELHGEKLKGRWMLVRKGGKRATEDKTWFLFKEKDKFAKVGSDIAKSKPRSVATGRSLEVIAKDADRVWGPKGEVRGKRPSRSGTESTPGAAETNGAVRKLAEPAKLTAANKTAITKKLNQFGEKQSRIPAKHGVELATLVDEPPTGDSWLHEIKFDGYRMLCRIQDGKARFISRNGKDWTAKFDELPSEVLALPVETAILDGEVVVLEVDGKSSFQALQNAFQTLEHVPFYYYVFDLLHLNGFDLTNAPLEERKDILSRLLRKKNGAVRYSDHVVGNGEAFFEQASKLGLEGIISKRVGRPYVAGRGNDWLKVKCSLREEFVIGGFTKPAGARTHFGAILLGYYDAGGDLVYAGRVGTGFSDATLEGLRQKFQKLIQKNSPFSNLRGTTGQARGVTWLRPELVGQVQFSNWTGDKQLRHPAFQGLREDKAARKVIRDEPVSSESIDSTKRAARASSSRTRGRSGRSHADGDQDENEIAGVTLSHPDKVLYPEDGYTKFDLAKHYEAAAEWMLPHVAGRLLSLVRCPAGSGQKCFFQKHPGEGTAELLMRTAVEEKDGPEDYLSVKDFPGLVALVQMGVLEIHIWGSRADNFEKPDRLIFDLDPDPAVKWPAVVASAKEVRILLQELGLESFLKTTGGKGLHIAVPIERRTSWDDAKAFCKAVADVMVAAAPNRYIAKMSKAARKGKIFVDYLRNDRGATAVAPYSTRAKPGATVSVPVSWDELTAKLHSDHFTIKNLPARLAKLKNDPWAGIADVKQSITASILKRLEAV